MKFDLKRLLTVAVLLTAGSLKAVDDLAWIPLEGTNRAPISVTSAVPVTSVIDTRPGPFYWESLAGDIFTFSWGLRLLFK